MLKTKKTMLVCGGSYGLGLEITKYFLKKKFKVIVLARDIKKLKKIKKIYVNYDLETYKCDLSNEKDSEKVCIQLEKKFKINYIICNAGSGKQEKKRKYLDYRKAFLSNFFTAVNVIENLTYKKNYLQRNIIVISSIAGHFKGRASLPYSLAKNSLINYVKYKSYDLSKKNVMINSISPGHIFIKGNNWDKKLKKDPKRVLKLINEDVGLKKFCSPDQIINTIEFIFSNKNTYITGADIVVDGGTK